ncbi:MAG TPA: DEAD/DEAH box helicase [Armatimonadota bacterium]|nr:DEAD/DEAH box helicase [Armatimonadota bacterium]
MLIRSLEAYGLPPVLLDAWQTEYGPELLPVQQSAVHAGVLTGCSVVVSSPTSSGKTFVGEMAAARAALEGRRVVYLVPTKALAEAKYRLFSRRYGELGLRVAIATGDRRGQQDGIARGEFDLTVAVPEKLRTLLLDRPAMAECIGAVVADELQVLGDAERGPCLELLLGDLVAESPGIQVVGLSAVLGQASEVARWLGAEMVCDHQRPIELRQGVLEGGVWHYRVRSSGHDGEERWPELDGGPDDPGERLAQVAAHLARLDGSALVFVPDKRTTVRLAREIASRGRLPAAEATAERLATLEPTQATACLRELAAAGVAFHNADLQFDEREAIERGFTDGDLSALVCTSTLAMGVNLPARNVLIDVRRWRAAPGGGQPTLGAITRAEFENMAGRAGRLGYEERFGRAVLIADTQLRRHILDQAYLTGDFGRLEPRLADRSPLQQVCLLTGSGAAAGAEGLAGAWRRTFSARVSDRSGDGLPADLEDAARLAADEGLLRHDPHCGWRATALGGLCGASGLSPTTFLRLLAAASAGEGEPPVDIEAVLVASLCEEAQVIPLGRVSGAQAFVDDLGDIASPVDDLRGRLERMVASGRAGSAVMRERAVRIALAVTRWRGRDATLDIERALHLPAGRLATLAETVGWIVQALGRIGRELGWPEVGWRRLVRLGESIAAGVPEEGLPLARLHVPGLTRGYILALLSAGVSSAPDLARADRGRLTELLGPELTERALLAAARSTPHPETVSATAAVAAPGSRPVLDHLLVVDTSRPDRVTIADRPVALRPAEFKLLWVLAGQAGRCVSYEDIYEGMWGAEHFVEPAQIYSHRSRLARKLEGLLPDRRDLLVTIPKHGLMLDLPPEQVLVQ